MKHALWMALAALFLFSCSPEEEAPVKKEVPGPESLVEIEGNMYKEYYPGKKQVKFQGPQDRNKQRHGVWHHFSEGGIEISTTEYNHGQKNGLSIVKYSNGQLYYTGEYRDDERAGTWRTYSPEGELIEEVNYDEPKPE